MSSEKDLNSALAHGFHMEIIYKNHNPARDEPKGGLTSTELGGSTPLASVPLKDIRTKLGSAIDQKWAFCLSNRSIIKDEATLGYYIKLVPAAIDTLLAPFKSVAETSSDESGSEATGEEGSQVAADVGPLVNPKVSHIPVVTLYMATAKSFSPSTNAPFSDPYLEKRPLNIGFNTTRNFNTSIPSKPENHKADFVPMDDWVGVSSENTKMSRGVMDIVFDLAEEDWQKLISMNRVFCAYEIRGRKLGASYARHSAFKLKEIEQMDGDSQDLLPAYVELFDTPSISISEVKSDFQSSLLNNAFSAQSFEYMSGGTIDIFSAAAQAGVGHENTTSSATSEGRAKREYHASYNFPRVKLYLNETTMEVTEPCQVHLLKIKEYGRLEDLISFHKRYGFIFSSAITLGGRLDATKFAKSDFDTEQNSEQDSFKTEMAISFSVAGLASAGMKGGIENQTHNITASTNVLSNSRLSWTATGGDTLLCANPPAWAGTVSIWRNWRVILRDEVVPLVELLSRYEQFSWVPVKFQEILTKAQLITPAPVLGTGPQLNSSKQWNNKTKIRLRLGNFCMSVDNDSSIFKMMNLSDSKQSSISVRNGVFTSKGATFQEKLPADSPLFFVLGNASELLGEDFFDAAFVDDDGSFCKQGKTQRRTRFSLRHAGTQGKWAPGKREPVLNGTKVNLYSHTFASGSFSKIDEPPTRADACVYNPSTMQLYFSTPSNVRSTFSGFVQAEFIVEYV